MKETDEALELYNRVYGMTAPLSYDREGVLERLVPLLRELGREAEADALVESEERAEKAKKERFKKYEKEDTQCSPGMEKHKPPPVISKKIGRNELCPCESGKKYKKCQGR